MYTTIDAFEIRWRIWVILPLIHLVNKDSIVF